MINLATLWFEIKAILNNEGKTVTLAVNREWFCHYTMPREVTHDQGGEFTGIEFQQLLKSYGIQSELALSCNLQGNSI
eukprot:8191897-Ditylum_brightwellii.AAC.1